MAAKLGIDPLEFRLRNLNDQRLIKVLKAAGEKFGWTSSRLASGTGIGLACAVDVGARVATMAEVDVSQGSGQVRVRRIVCALDIGQVFNPEGALMQTEGSLMMGLGYALTEEFIEGFYNRQRLHQSLGYLSPLEFERRIGES